jgi:guanylate kinase
LIVVVSGPGGVGKGTVVAALVERDRRLWLSRSWTTRERRPGESDQAYVFATRDEFEMRKAAGGFLEWAEYLGELYGTPTPEAPEGMDVVLEIELEGARQVRERHPDALLVFLDAPSEAVQEARLRGRGDPDDKVAERLAAAPRERALAAHLGMEVLVNDDLETTVESLAGLIEQRRATRASRS